MTTAPAPAQAQRRSGTERTLLWLEALLAVGAYGGAIGFLAGGIDLGDAAQDLPFGSLTFAAIALALVNGVLPTAVLIGALRARAWARVGHLVVGVALVVWIVVQVAFLGPPIHVLQAIYFVWGGVIVVLALRVLARRG